MDQTLWRKLQSLARRGERVVIVEGGDEFVLLPLAEYERLSNGDASLQRVAGIGDISFENSSVDKIVDDDDLDIPFEPPELADIVESAKPVAEPPAPASDALEEEERFYLEPIE